ncbi:MAG: hypothetical protein ACPGXK_04010, partial [Phycisphaerae bacterium]
MYLQRPQTTKVTDAVSCCTTIASRLFLCSVSVLLFAGCASDQSAQDVSQSSSNGGSGAANDRSWS